MQDVNIIPMVTTQKRAIVDTQKKVRKEFKYFTIKIKLNTKEDYNSRNEEQRNERTYRKQIAQ